MSELVQLGAGRRPPWLRVKINESHAFREVKQLLNGLELNTVCADARCPNIWECWGEHRTATFMILGEVCTRACRYCSVTSGKPPTLPDPQEPGNVADAVERLKLKYAVLTSVDRDDLDDYGASHWADTIRAIQARTPQTGIELLVPDFCGDMGHVRTVLSAGPQVFGHNVETVPRLYKRMRSRGVYQRCLDVLRFSSEYRHREGLAMRIKSGLMLGLGEDLDEVRGVMRDLRAQGVDVLTMGQYLNPSRKHAPVQRFYTPEEFETLKAEGLALGFAHVESGPLVRSSYHAHEHAPGARLR